MSGDPPTRVPRVLSIGLVSGLAAGLLGIGGGALMVPLLVAFAGIGQRAAHVVSLGAVIPISLAAAIAYGISDEVRLGTALVLFAGGAIGAPLGTFLLSRANDRVARRAFGVLLVATAIYLLVT